MSNRYTVSVTINSIDECTVNYTVTTSCSGENCPDTASLRILDDHLHQIYSGTININIGGEMSESFSFSDFGNGTYSLDVIYGTSSDEHTVTITNCICIHPDMLVQTRNGLKKIKDVCKDDEVLTYDNSYIKVLYNIVNGKTNKFYKIPKNSLNIDIPNEDFYIHGDHPILYNNKEIIPRDLMNIIPTIELVTRKDSVDIYTLCTSERTVFKISGELLVYTFEEKEFKEYAEKTNLIYYIK